MTQDELNKLMEELAFVKRNTNVAQVHNALCRMEDMISHYLDEDHNVLGISILGGKNDEFDLSVIYNVKKDKFSMPSLKTPTDDYWDNPDWLFSKLIPYLNDDLSNLSNKDLEEIQEHIPLKYKAIVRNMMNLAIKLDLLNEES